MKKTRVTIVDEHVDMRETLCTLIGSQPDLEAVGKITAGAHAAKRIRATAPDVVVHYLATPNLNSIEAIRELNADSPRIRSLVVSMHGDVKFLRDALLAGVSGYVGKHIDEESLLTAIRELALGRSTLNVCLNEGALETLVRGSRIEDRTLPPPDPRGLLSDRERQVLTHIAHGYTSKEAASKLGISAGSVDTYRVRALRKLGLKGRADLVRYALKTGILSPS